MKREYTHTFIDSKTKMPRKAAQHLIGTKGVRQMAADSYTTFIAEQLLILTSQQVSDPGNREHYTHVVQLGCEDVEYTITGIVRLANGHPEGPNPTPETLLRLLVNDVRIFEQTRTYDCWRSFCKLEQDLEATRSSYNRVVQLAHKMWSMLGNEDYEYLIEMVR